VGGHRSDGVDAHPAGTLGGDDATAYNWQTNIKNNTGDNRGVF